MVLSVLAYEWAYKSQSPISGTGRLTEHFKNMFIHQTHNKHFCKNQQDDQDLWTFPSMLTGFWVFKNSDKRDFLEVQER